MHVSLNVVLFSLEDKSMALGIAVRPAFLSRLGLGHRLGFLVTRW